MTSIITPKKGFAIYQFMPAGTIDMNSITQPGDWNSKETKDIIDELKRKVVPHVFVKFDWAVIHGVNVLGPIWDDNLDHGMIFELREQAEHFAKEFLEMHGAKWRVDTWPHEKIIY